MVNPLPAIIVARTPTAQDYAKEFKSMATQGVGSLTPADLN
jgi:hypothetical protein